MKQCPKCRLPTKWTKIGLRWHLQDPDGKDHFDTCSKEWWRIVSTTGKRFENKNDSGYLLHGKKFYDWKRGLVITGERYTGRTDDDLENSPNPWSRVNVA